MSLFSSFEATEQQSPFEKAFLKLAGSDQEIDKEELKGILNSYIIGKASSYWRWARNQASLAWLQHLHVQSGIWGTPQ